MHSLLAKAPTAARILFGLIFTVFGLNGFLSFLPMPPMPEAAGTFLGALVGSGYLMALVKATEIGVGLLLLSNRFVPLALTIAAPIVLNIVLFHAVLAPAGMLVPLVVLAFELFLAWSYRDAFAPMLRAKHEPAVGETRERERGHAHA